MQNNGVKYQMTASGFSGPGSENDVKMVYNFSNSTFIYELIWGASGDYSIIKLK